MSSRSENPLRSLIREIHRRSLWQVLGIYLAGSWVAYEVAQRLTEGLGLPTCLARVALVLLIVGLPVVLAIRIDRGRRSGGEGPLPPGRPSSTRRRRS